MLLEAALSQIVEGKDEDGAAASVTAATKVLPPARACSDQVCSFPDGAKPQCAYSYLPKAAGPDVGDWMDNTTSTLSTRWVSGVAPGSMACNNKEYCTDADKSTSSKAEWKDKEVCFDAAKKCSYLDQKRGFTGNGDSGPIAFVAPAMHHCKIWIGEPGYEWDKPKDLANWELELEVKVNGALCVQPQCRVTRDGYLQTLVIDAQAIVGSSCKNEGSVVVALEVKPVTDDTITCDSSCKPNGVWEGYSGRLCKSHSCAKGNGFTGRYGSKSDIRTFVSQIIAF